MVIAFSAVCDSVLVECAACSSALVECAVCDIPAGGECHWNISGCVEWSLWSHQPAAEPEPGERCCLLTSTGADPTRNVQVMYRFWICVMDFLTVPILNLRHGFSYCCRPENYSSFADEVSWAEFVGMASATDGRRRYQISSVNVVVV